MAMRIHLRKSAAFLLLIAVAFVPDLARAQHGQSASPPQKDVPAESPRNGERDLQTPAPKRHSDEKRAEEPQSGNTDALQGRYRRPKLGEGDPK
jgi:hypothetical protein